MVHVASKYQRTKSFTLYDSREILANETTLENMVDSPATVTRIPIETLQSGVWEDARIRLAQLIRDREAFLNIAVYYHNVTIVRNVMSNTALSNTNKEVLIPQSADSTKQMGSEAMETVDKYGELPETGYALIVPLSDEE